MAHSAPGDFDIFVDQDGTGYIIYTSVNEGHDMSIEKLTSDFLNSTLESSGFLFCLIVDLLCLYVCVVESIVDLLCLLTVCDSCTHVPVDLL